jgi:hypothetical protein
VANDCGLFLRLELLHFASNFLQRWSGFESLARTNEINPLQDIFKQMDSSALRAIAG